METNFKNITEEIRFQEGIKASNNLKYIYSLIILLGLVITAIAFTDTYADDKNTSSAIIFTGLTVACIGIYYTFSSSKLLTYMPTHERIRKTNYYFNANEKDMVLDMYNSKNFDALKATSSENFGYLTVVLYSTKSKGVIYSQILQYEGFEYIPITDITK